MFYIILIILLIIGTLGAATYGGVLLMQTTQSMSDLQTNQRRLEMVAWNLRNNGGVYSSTYTSYLGRFASYTGPAATDYSMPDPAIFASPYTQGGINFHYCPYSPITTNGTTTTIVTPSSVNNYIAHFNYLGTASFLQKIVTRTRNSANSADIVVDTDAPSDTLHLVTAPTANGSVAPQCNALTSTNGATTVPGGNVIAVTSRQILNEHIYSAAKIMTLYAAPASSGDGSGYNAANAMTLDQAMEAWRTALPRVLIINLAAGTYNVTSTTMAATNLTAGNPIGMKLIWRGAGSGSTNIGTSGVVTVDLPVDFQMESVTFAPTYLYAQKGGNLFLSDAILTLKALKLSGGNLTTSGTSSTITSGQAEIFPASTLSLIAPLRINGASLVPAIKLYGGTINSSNSGALTVYAPNTGAGIYIVSGQVSMDNNIDIYATTGTLARGILVAPAGQLNISQNLIVHSTPSVAAIENAGITTIGSGASLQVPDGAAVGVRLISGGEFYNNGTIGSATAAERPVIGVEDKGGNKIGGGNTTAPGLVYATVAGACWNFVAVPAAGTDDTIRPTLFSRSYEGDTAISAPTAPNQPYVDFLQMDNRSYWTCSGPTPGLNPPPPPPACTSSGAGDATYNGAWYAAGTYNTKPYYTNANGRVISWNGGSWGMGPNQGSFPSSPLFYFNSFSSTCPLGAWQMNGPTAAPTTY